MPKKTPRPPGPDDWAADRIRYERERRGWSTAELARRVSLAGVPMRQQQVWQVESGQPPRRLSIGEAAAFAKVLEIPLADLTVPPHEIAPRRLIEIGRAFAEWRRDSGVLAARLLDIDQQIRALGDDELYIAAVLEKYSGLGDGVDEIVRDLETITENYGVIMESIKEHGPVWVMVASMKPLIPSSTESEKGRDT